MAENNEHTRRKSLNSSTRVGMYIAGLALEKVLLFSRTEVDISVLDTGTYLNMCGFKCRTTRVHCCGLVLFRSFHLQLFFFFFSPVEPDHLSASIVCKMQECGGGLCLWSEEKGINKSCLRKYKVLIRAFSVGKANYVIQSKLLEMGKYLWLWIMWMCLSKNLLFIITTAFVEASK